MGASNSWGSRPPRGEVTRSRRLLWLRPFARRPFAQASLALLLFVFLVAAVAPAVGIQSPTAMSVRDRLSAPSQAHWMGTDDLGRDVFSRMVHGARLSMEISLLAMILTTAAGTVVGLLSAYYKSMDGLLMRIMDGLMAFPAILLAIAIIAALGASAMNVVLALSLVLTPTMSRVVRSAALTVSHMEFTTAARATGSRDSRIIFRHILPNCLSPIIVQATFVFAQSVLAEAALSFLGVGAPPPAPSWGNILSDGRNYLNMAPWLTIFPGVAISLSVLSLNVVGDTLRDALDPRLRT